jgi:uncharacterized membrane protein
LLILGCAVLLGLLVTVVINASALFLQQRSLASTADAAALAAAQSLDAQEYYARGASAGVPLDPQAARDAVDRIALEAEGPWSGPVDVVEVAVSDDVVSVRLAVRARLPVLNELVAAGQGAPITAEASARSPLLG